MPQKQLSFGERLRLASKVLTTRKKEFIPALTPFDEWGADAAGRLNRYTNKPAQISANVGWCFAANEAIVNPTAAVKLKLYRRKKDGEREEIDQHQILELFDSPNLVHTGEQMRQLHFTYMNFTGEGYTQMVMGNGNEFIPAPGRLPDALHIFPSHKVTFELGKTYTTSVVKLGQVRYPVLSFIRDLSPDPDRPYFGRSIIAASAAAIDTEAQMKEWNERFFANNARPSLVFKSDEPMTDEAYARWKQQFSDDNTGTENAYKPLLMEGGDVTALVNQHDLDFINGREFSMKEILSMWRVSPGMLGQVENVNRANLEAGHYLNAVTNVVPRIRQYVRQMNATFIKVYDPLFELDFENPVPEDVEVKLRTAEAGVDKWWTKDEVREMYGEKPLPDHLGEHMIVIGKGGARTLEEVVAGELDEPADEAKPKDSQDEQPADDPQDKDKALHGVKKKP